MKLPTRLSRILALVLVVDVVFLLFLYFPPHQQDGLSNLFLSFVVGIVNIVAAVVLLLLKKARWSLALFFNAFLMLFAINYFAIRSSRISWKSEHLEYTFEANDSIFKLIIDKNDSLFFLHSSNHEGYFCSGIYQKKPDNVYILDVDTTHITQNANVLHFVIKNDSIERIGVDKLPLKTSFF